MPGQLSERVKSSRKAKLMRLQKRISRRKSEEQVGKTLLAIVDGSLPEEESEEGVVYCARSRRDCYGVDGMIFFPSAEELMTGDFVWLEIVGCGDYDLWGKRVVDPGKPEV
jgi:ribosomal protein S12 methylthiotransferase